MTFLAASATPTPLYATYQKAWGFSALTTTVVFGIYAIAFLSALLTVGRLSDHVGRRPVLLAGIAGQILALVIFVDAHSVTALVAARVVQGLAAGTAIGAVGAGHARHRPDPRCGGQRHRPGLGTASGALFSAFAVQWLPAPTRLVYVVLAGVLVVQAFGVTLLARDRPRAPGAWASLVPQVALPPQTRRPMMAAAPVLFAVWALGGFYASLGPSLIDHLAGSTSVIDAGLGLGILAGARRADHLRPSGDAGRQRHAHRHRARSSPAPSSSCSPSGPVLLRVSSWRPPWPASASAAASRVAFAWSPPRLIPTNGPVCSPCSSPSRIWARPARRVGRVGRRARRRPRGHQLRVRPGRDRLGRLRHL